MDNNDVAEFKMNKNINLMDFKVGLPCILNGYNTIWVIMDKLTVFSFHSNEYHVLYVEVIWFIYQGDCEVA